MHMLSQNFYMIKGAQQKLNLLGLSVNCRALMLLPPPLPLRFHLSLMKTYFASTLTSLFPYLEVHNRLFP